MKQVINTKLKLLFLLFIFLFGSSYAQIPTAGFSIFPNPVCQGQPVQITNLSTGNPTSWSYTVGVPNSFYSAQSPSFTAGAPGTMTVRLIVSNAAGSSTMVSQTFTVNALPNAVINPTTPAVCSPGTPLTFTASNLNAGNTFSWSTGATGSVTTVTPSVSTSYSLVVTNTAGCSVTRTTNVLVGSSTSITASPLSVCQGGSVTLNASGSGPFPFTYTWSSGANTSNMSTNIPGVYTASVTNGIGCISFESYTLTTSSTLSLTAQASLINICAGSNSQLSVTGASNYTWSTSSNQPFISVSPTTTTTYSVLGATSTCTGTAFITVSVIPTPTLAVLNNSAAICAGQSATLNLTGASSFSLNNVSTGPVLVITPLSSTSFTLKGVSPGCPGGSLVVNVTVTPIPTVQIVSSKTMACVGDKLTYTGSGASTYSWSTGGALVTTTLIANAGTTLVTVTGSNTGCSSMQSYTQAVKVCTGVEEMIGNKSKLKIFPNPSREIYITSEIDQQVVIMDQCGRILKVVVLEQDKPYVIVDLVAGMYYLVETDAGGSTAHRLMITD